MNNQILNAFLLEGEIVSSSPLSKGLINDSYIITTTCNTYLIQRMNGHIFKRIDILMKNFELVTKHLKKVVQDPLRNTLTLINTKDGQAYYHDASGDYRCILFIKDTYTYDTLKQAEMFEAVGKAFGTFQAQLDDFDASLLEETIPNFHNTPYRFMQFKQALDNASEDRKNEAKKEIDFLLAREAQTHLLYDAALPLRVTHNDAKLNNILFDKTTSQPLCIVDLDTIMPGYAANDFGDAIRSGATHAKEDETNLDLVTLDLEYFKAFYRGFVATAPLTKEEILTLPKGGYVITLEQALRFLTDYLENDHYYKVDYPTHNLVRARTQIKLVMEHEDHQEEIQAMRKEILNEKEHA